MITVAELVKDVDQQLRDVSPTSRLDAEILVRWVTGFERHHLLTRGSEVVSSEHEQAIREALRRRKAHEPIAYILGEKEFYGRSFRVTPAVLIPRPETETLVERALTVAALVSGEVSLLDLGTGSGCIAITVIAELIAAGRRARAVAVDRSAQALSVARANAEHLGVHQYIDFRCGSWFEPVGADQFDMILSNPPYVSSADTLPQSVLFEPHGALFSGIDGLRDVKQILAEAPRYLKSRAPLLMEIGAGQSSDVRRIAESAGASEVQFHRDLALHERVVEVVYGGIEG